MRDLGSTSRLRLPVHGSVRFVLARPHYPENLGACARALKTMGFSELVLLRPGRLCRIDHEMAFKMAVKSWDVLEKTSTVEHVSEAVTGAHFVVATTARRGVSHVRTLRSLAPEIVYRADRGEHTAILFGNEKTGLSEHECAPAHAQLRIPMVADQPSINLAQAVQLVAYELLIAALELRESRPRGDEVLSA